MATSYPGAVQVGSYFVGQYYQVLQQQPELVHRFYSDASTMIRVDGDLSETASAMLQIHTMVTTINFTEIEIKTINSLDSWNGGVLVMVSGSVKTKEFNNRRKFVQTFFLAPQEKGFFVMNDIFQFFEDESVYHHLAQFGAENNREAQLNASNPHPEPQDYILEQEAREYVSSVRIDDDPIDKYSLSDNPGQHQEEDDESEAVVEETPLEETSAPASYQAAVDTPQEPLEAATQELAEEPTKKTYASILRIAKESAVPVVSMQPAANKNSAATDEWDHVPQPIVPQPTVQQSSAPSQYMSEYGVEAAEYGSGFEDVEFKSVYVRNLPSTVTVSEIEDIFKNFGQIKPDGVFMRNRKDVVGVCYAFVEYEDLVAVDNAIKASPIELGGRQVYIEERRPNPSGIRGGRRGGRGRGGYPTDAGRGRFGARNPGRGSYLDGGEQRRRGDGFYQRGAR